MCGGQERRLVLSRAGSVKLNCEECRKCGMWLDGRGMLADCIVMARDYAVFLVLRLPWVVDCCSGRVTEAYEWQAGVRGRGGVRLTVTG